MARVARIIKLTEEEMEILKTAKTILEDVFDEIGDDERFTDYEGGKFVQEIVDAVDNFYDRW